MQTTERHIVRQEQQRQFVFVAALLVLFALAKVAQVVQDVHALNRTDDTVVAYLARSGGDGVGKTKQITSDLFTAVTLGFQSLVIA